MSEEYRVGDRVEKHSGTYTTFGEVRAAYVTKAGAVRYVVEVEPQGFQMIWSAKELRPASMHGKQPQYVICHAGVPECWHLKPENL